jgi:hypothetical protein
MVGRRDRRARSSLTQRSVLVTDLILLGYLAVASATDVDDRSRTCEFARNGPVDLDLSGFIVVSTFLARRCKAIGPTKAVGLSGASNHPRQQTKGRAGWRTRSTRS